VVNHTQIHGNGTGIILNGANGAVNMLVRDSIVDTSASHGISVTTGATHAGATIQNSTVAFNAGTGVNVSGAGGIAMVMGARANAGVLSPYPSLSALDREDNLQVTVDFRKVYASLIEQWLGTSAAEVIPNAGAFGRVQLVR